MDCPICGAPAFPDGPDIVVDSNDGPLLFTRWRCASNHWWHMTIDVSPVCATSAEHRPAERLAKAPRHRLVTHWQAGAMAALSTDRTRLAGEPAAMFPGSCQRAGAAITASPTQGSPTCP